MLFLNFKDAYLPVKLRQHYAGKAAMFGGAVEEGETPIEALERELREETGDWLDTVRMPGYRKSVVGLEAQNGFACVVDGVSKVYALFVDAGVSSFRHLSRSCSEGAAVAVLASEMSKQSPDYFAPGFAEPIQKVAQLILNSSTSH